MAKKFVSDLDFSCLIPPKPGPEYLTFSNRYKTLQDLKNDDGFIVLHRVNFDKFLRSIYPPHGDRKYAFFYSDAVEEGNEITDPALIQDLENLWKKKAFNKYAELWIRL